MATTLLSDVAGYVYNVGAAGNRLRATETVRPGGVAHTIGRSLVTAYPVMP